MKKPKNSLLIFTVFFSAPLIVASAILGGILFLWPKENKGVSVAEIGNQSLRCGINATYLATRFLGAERSNSRYSSLGNYFSMAEEKGVSLEQIYDYFKESGFSCVSTKLTKDNLKNLSTQTVVFVLRKEKPISHIYLLRRSERGLLQAIDIDNGIQELREDDANKLIRLKRHALFVARDSQILPNEDKMFSYKIRLIILSSLCCVFIFVIIVLLRKRKSIIKKQQNELRMEDTEE